MWCEKDFKGFSDTTHDCLDWVVAHLGHRASLIKAVVRIANPNAISPLILRDPTLLDCFEDWRYFTRDPAIIGNAILHGRVAKLAPKALLLVGGLHEYRVKARLDDYLRQNLFTSLWLVLELDHDLEPY